MNSNNYKKKPFFSIVTVVKNDEKNIKITLESIFNQDFEDYEYIIIDGKSNDKTLSIVNEYKKNINLIVSELDDGIYYAMNKGAKLSNGKFLVFVNSGDILTPSALKIIHNKISSNPEVDFIFGTVKRHYTKDIILKFGFDSKRLKFNFDFATSHSTGFFVKKSKFKQIGYFDTQYKCSADYDVYYKLIILNNLNGISTNKDELIGEVSPGGFSSKLSFYDHLLEETKIRINNNQNIFIVILIFINALIKKLFK